MLPNAADWDVVNGWFTSAAAAKRSASIEAWCRPVLCCAAVCADTAAVDAAGVAAGRRAEHAWRLGIPQDHGE